MEMITVLNTVLLLYSQLGQAPPLPLLTQRDCSVHGQGCPSLCSLGKGHASSGGQRELMCPRGPTLPKEEQRPSSDRGAQGYLLSNPQPSPAATSNGQTHKKMGVVQPLDCTLRLLMSANWARSPAAWFQSYPYPHQPVVDWTLWPHLR